MTDAGGAGAPMDDILGQAGAAFWVLWEKCVALGAQLLDAAWHKAVDLLALAAGVVERLAAKVAAVPLWVSLPVAVLLLACCVAYALRQRLYDRLLVYHLFWLRHRGFSRHVFHIRRGAVRENRQAMARPVPLSGRFSSLAVYEVHPDRYIVAYGVAGDRVEAARAYRRDRRAGIRAMADDLIAYARANVRMLHADAELRALFAALDAFDPVFAAWRPSLPGEEREPTHGVSLPQGRPHAAAG